MNYTALIVAAGKGSRMGLGYNKVFYLLSEGKTVLEKTMDIFKKDPRCKQIVVVMRKDDVLRGVRNSDSGSTVHVVGGSTRQESVYNGLMATTQNRVLIHDCARPFLTQDCLDNLIEALEHEKACILAVPMKDTVKEVIDGYIVKTHQRENLMSAQTPQAFETDFIIKCYKKARALNLIATDDAQVVEMTSDQPVKIVLGNYFNQKITTIEDVK